MLGGAIRTVRSRSIPAPRPAARRPLDRRGQPLARRDSRTEAFIAARPGAVRPDAGLGGQVWPGGGGAARDIYPRLAPHFRMGTSRAGHARRHRRRAAGSPMAQGRRFAIRQAAKARFRASSCRNSSSGAIPAAAALAGQFLLQVRPAQLSPPGRKALRIGGEGLPVLLAPRTSTTAAPETSQSRGLPRIGDTGGRHRSGP